MTITRCLCVLITLLLTYSQSLAKGGGFGRSEDRYDPQHIESLPPEVRAAVFRQCGTPRALYPFAHYADNLQRVVLAYEHFYCGTGGTLSGEMSCVVIDRDACGACFASQAYAL